MKRMLFVAAAIAAASFALAGPLDPPAGPVSSTMKTLDQVEPRIPIQSLPGDGTAVYVISQPGSYYLTGNVTGVAAKAGIKVTANHVSIDLCGFALTGVFNSTIGVEVVDGGRFVSVRNGIVRSWGGPSGGAGVKLGSSCIAENLIVSGTVSGFGISAVTNSSITNCVADSNQGDGIFTQSGCSIKGCTASLNLGDGFTVGNGSTALNCAAYDNMENGFNGAGAEVLEACTAASNGIDGFSLSAGAVVRSCVARDNTAIGIDAGVGSTVEGCTAYSNDGDGIVVGSGSSVSGCTAVTNGTNGIRTGSDCRIEHNTCDSNGAIGAGSGIRVVGSDNRIDSNTCADNDIGFEVDIADNLIIRNSASGNTTNWVIVANNKVGPIVAAPNSVAINGDTGGAGVGSTNPWANFTF